MLVFNSFKRHATNSVETKLAENRTDLIFMSGGMTLFVAVHGLFMHTSILTLYNA